MEWVDFHQCHMFNYFHDIVDIKFVHFDGHFLNFDVGDELQNLLLPNID